MDLLASYYDSDLSLSSKNDDDEKDSSKLVNLVSKGEKINETNTDNLSNALGHPKSNIKMDLVSISNINSHRSKPGERKRKRNESEIDSSNVFHFKRSKPHVKGNWAGHVYLDILNQDTLYSSLTNGVVLLETVQNSILAFQHFIEKDDGKKATSRNTEISSNADSRKDEHVVLVSHIPLRNETQSSDHEESDEDNSTSSDEDSCESKSTEQQTFSLHISLTKSFYLQKQSIESFLQEVGTFIASTLLTPFCVQLPITSQVQKNGEKKSSICDLEILSNDEKTRSFLTIPLDGTLTDLSNIESIVDMMNKVMIKYGLEPYYKDPKFHISICSWNYCKAIIDKWNNRRSQSRGSIFNSSDEDSNLDTIEETLTVQVAGINCDFGTVEKHFFSFQN